MITIEQWQNIMMQQERTKKAFVRCMNINVKIANLARFVATGGAAKDAEDYYYLVTELGEDVLQEQLGKILLTMENKNG